METNAIVGGFGEIFGRVERLMLFRCRGDEYVDHLRIARQKVETARREVLECGARLAGLRERYEIGRTADDVVDHLEDDEGWMNSIHWMRTRARYIHDELDEEDDEDSFFMIEDPVRKDVEDLADALSDLVHALGLEERWEKQVMRMSIGSEATLHHSPLTH